MQLGLLLHAGKSSLLQFMSAYVYKNQQMMIDFHRIRISLPDRYQPISVRTYWNDISDCWPSNIFCLQTSWFSNPPTSNPITSINSLIEHYHHIPGLPGSFLPPISSVRLLLPFVKWTNHFIRFNLMLRTMSVLYKARRVERSKRDGVGIFKPFT